MAWTCAAPTARHVPERTYAWPIPVAEHHVRVVIEEFLRRTPHPGEVEAIAAQCPNAEILLEAVLSSDEFKRRRAVSHDEPEHLWVNLWHPDLAAWTPPAGTLSPNRAVCVGHDGQLFLVEGTNRFVEQYTGLVTVTDDWLATWQRLMAARAADPLRQRVTVVSLVVPDPLVVFHDLFPAPLAPGRRPVQLLLEAGVDLLYPLELIEADRDAFRLRTDTHYTDAGTHALATLIAAHVPGAPAIPISDLHPEMALGDLGSRFSPPILELRQVAARPTGVTALYDNWPQMEALGRHVGTRQVFHNASAEDPRRVVLFGDSYSHGTRGLARYLSAAFAEVHFLWVPFGWDSEYASAVSADVVIEQAAERFIVRPPEIDARFPLEASV